MEKRPDPTLSLYYALDVITRDVISTVNGRRPTMPAPGRSCTFRQQDVTDYVTKQYGVAYHGHDYLTRILGAPFKIKVLTLHSQALGFVQILGKQFMYNT